MAPFEYMALKLSEKAAMAFWMATLSDHSAEAIAPRIAAWRVLQGLRRQVADAEEEM